jgi:CheY-like chemotaxis protein
MLFENRTSQNGSTSRKPPRAYGGKFRVRCRCRLAPDENGSPVALYHHMAKALPLPYIAASVGHPTEPPMLAPSRNLQILLIDSESAALDASVGVPEKLGYQHIQTASDGSYGLGLLDDPDDPIDLVTCDLVMPEMDGIELMRRLHDIGYLGALLLLSCENRRILDIAMQLARSYHLNILGVLQKPLHPEALDSLLGKLAAPGAQKQYAQTEPISRKELRAGITGMSSGGLDLFYQPKVHIRSGEIRSAEVVARWQPRNEYRPRAQTRYAGSSRRR